jgi:hypothetical protein
MRQPHSTITTGVRQPMLEAFEVEGIEMAMTTTCFAIREQSLGQTPGGCLYGVAPSSSNKNLGYLPPPAHGS